MFSPLFISAGKAVRDFGLRMFSSLSTIRAFGKVFEEEHGDEVLKAVMG